jgi:hypothetical protein
MMHCCQQDIMASVKIASSATRATDHSLYFKFIKVTTCTCTLLVLTAPAFVLTHIEYANNQTHISMNMVI